MARASSSDVSAASGLDYTGHSSGAVFFDYDKDGRLDLFLVNVGTVHDRGDAGDGYKYYVAFEDAFTGHLKPERAERSILFHNEGENRFVDVSQRMGIMDTSWTGDACDDRRQRRWLARSLPAEHAGRRPVLRERGRQAVRQEEPPDVSAHVLGRDGHQGVRLQQRRAPRHLHHRHALGHERHDRPRAGQAEVGR